MAVHCGVCGTRIFEAFENYGNFSTTVDFKGWKTRDGDDLAQIEDTCLSCYKTLCSAVTVAANTIVEANRPQVEELRKELASQRDRDDRLKKEKFVFEKEWAERARKLV